MAPQEQAFLDQNISQTENIKQKCQARRCQVIQQSKLLLLEIELQQGKEYPATAWRVRPILGSSLTSLFGRLWGFSSKSKCQSQTLSNTLPSAFGVFCRHYFQTHVTKIPTL